MRFVQFQIGNRNSSRRRQALKLSPQKQLVAQLPEVMARDEVPDRPGRREPRAVKRRPKPYQLLNRPRHLMKELPHRSKYRKTS